MNTERSNILAEWDKTCKSVLKNLKKLGHDIILTCAEEDLKIQRKNERNTEAEEIQAGEIISWDTPVGKEKIERSGMVVAVIPKGESAMKCVLKGTKRNFAKFSNISTIDRVLIANVDEAGNMHYLCPDIRKVKANIRRT